MKVLKFIKNNILSQVLICIGLGVVVGLICPEFGKQTDIISLAFIKLIRLVITPLVFITIVLGICQDSQERLGRLAAKTLIYFEVIAVLAIGISFAVTFWLKPGIHFNVTQAFHADISSILTQVSTTKTGIKEYLLQIIPDNVFATLAGQNLLAVMLLATIIALALKTISQKTIIIDNLQI